MDTNLHNYFTFDKEAIFDYCSYKIDTSKKVIYISFNRDVFFTLEMGKDLFYKAFDFFPTERVHVIINISEKTQIQANSLDFIASEERVKKVISDAFIINSSTLKLVSNFYLRIKKPKIKTKIFTTTKEAFVWTQDQLNLY